MIKREPTKKQERRTTWKKKKMDTADHKTRMQELMKIREVRALKQEITHLKREQLKEILRDQGFNARGNLAVKRDRTLRAKVKEAGLEPGMVPWYPSDLPEEGAEGEESSSDEEMVLLKAMKKKRGRKQKVPVDNQESNTVTTDDGAQEGSRLRRTEINEIVGVVEPVTSTSGMTARGTSTASYSTAAMPTIEISTTHNASSSANTSLPGTAVMH